jgi:spore coat protein JB
MNEKKMLMNKCSALRFAAFELHLYLDTHPYDLEAMRQFREYSEKAKQCINEYEAAYGPINAASSGNTEKWSWVSDPWPWEDSEDF